MILRSRRWSFEQIQRDGAKPPMYMTSPPLTKIPTITGCCRFSYTSWALLPSRPALRFKPLPRSGQCHAHLSLLSCSPPVDNVHALAIWSRLRGPSNPCLIAFGALWCLDLHATSCPDQLRLASNMHDTHPDIECRICSIYRPGLWHMVTSRLVLWRIHVTFALRFHQNHSRKFTSSFKHSLLWYFFQSNCTPPLCWHMIWILWLLTWNDNVLHLKEWVSRISQNAVRSAVF